MSHRITHTAPSQLLKQWNRSGVSYRPAVERMSTDLSLSAAESLGWACRSTQNPVTSTADDTHKHVSACTSTRYVHSDSNQTHHKHQPAMPLLLLLTYPPFHINISLSESNCYYLQFAKKICCITVLYQWQWVTDLLNKRLMTVTLCSIKTFFRDELN